MKKNQYVITITAEQAKALRELASKEPVTEGDVIRQALAILEEHKKKEGK